MSQGREHHEINDEGGWCTRKARHRTARCTESWSISTAVVMTGLVIDCCCCYGEHYSYLVPFHTAAACMYESTYGRF